MSSDETPTPRLTGQWDVWAKGARDLVDELRALELAASRVLASTRARARAERARYARNLAAAYAAAFERWNRESVPLDEKGEDQKEFGALCAYSRALLAGKSGLEEPGRTT